MKNCKVCDLEFSSEAMGPWCHGCVGYILSFLGMPSAKLARLTGTAEVLRQQLRDAKAAGKTPDDTDVPGPYWGLEL
jgi:hypothetical protein